MQDFDLLQVLFDKREQLSSPCLVLILLVGYFLDLKFHYAAICNSFTSFLHTPYIEATVSQHYDFIRVLFFLTEPSILVEPINKLLVLSLLTFSPLVLQGIRYSLLLFASHSLIP